MTSSIDFISKSIPGCGAADGSCLPCSRVSGRAHSLSPNSSCAHYKLPFDVKLLSLKCASRSLSLVCFANSSNYRKNTDFSRQNNHGVSRNRNWGGECKEGYENLEESEFFSSRSGNTQFRANVNLNPREKEIIELFRKAQALLRERSAAKKEERKVEGSQGKKGESMIVDSLSNLLRKHSVQQGKKNTISGNGNFMMDQNEHNPLAEERSTSFPDSRSSFKHQVQETTKPHFRQTVLNSFRKSRVPEVKFQPFSISRDNVDSGRKQIDLNPEDDLVREVELDSESDSDSESDVDLLFTEENVFDEILASELFKTEQDEATKEVNLVEANSLSGMKVAELRNLAKAHGLKGFSKMKKNDLIELLNETI